MNAKEAERKLRIYLRGHPRVTAPSGLLTHLCEGIQAQPTHRNHQAVAQALLEMQRKGHVKIEGDQRNLKGVTYTEQVPDPQLPNGSPTPAPTAPPSVTPTTVAGPTQVGPQTSSPRGRLSGQSFVDELNRCFKVLVGQAQDGVGEGLSVRKVLQEGTDLRTGQISRIMQVLTGMGYYTTVMSGYARSTYTLDLTMPPVTPEAYEAFVADMPTLSPQLVSAPPPNPSPSSAAGQVEADSTVLELIGLVETLQASFREVTADRDRLRLDCDELTAQLAQASTGAATVANLEQELARVNTELARLRTAQAATNEQARTALARFRAAQ